jgi:hypothetical protein
MTIELADYLLELDKYVVVNGNTVEKYFLDIQYPMSFRLTLSTLDDLDQNLLVDIKESERKSLKINLHHQDNGTQNGLLRVDYNSRHLNPVGILDSVPEKFRPFAGQWLDDYPAHIHYVVDGYKPLAWAIPLELDDFPVKELNSSQDYVKTLKAFFHKINLRTEIIYRHQMRLL